MEPISKLGKGAFGHVLLASQNNNFGDRRTSEFIAVKCINLKKYRKISGMKKFIER